MPESINPPRQRITEEKLGVQDEPRGSIRPYVTERGRLGGPGFYRRATAGNYLWEKTPRQKKGNNPPGKGSWSRNEGAYFVCDRTHEPGTPVYAKNPIRNRKVVEKNSPAKKGEQSPGKGSWSRKKGILRKWEGAYDCM